MADFVDRLRMNNIFPSGNYNPFGPGAGGGGGGGFNPDIIGPILRRVVPFLESQQRDEREFQTNQIAQQKRGQLEEIARATAMQGKADKVAPKNRQLVYDPNLSMTANQKAQLGLEREKLKSSEAIAQGKLGVQQGQLGVSQQKADIQAWKARNPNSKIVTPGDGRVYAIDPITNEIQDLGIDTLSVQEKLELQGKNALELQGARATTQKELEGVRAKNAMERTTAEIEGRIRTKATPSGDSTGMLPTQVRVDQSNRARELLVRQPELADYIDFDPTTGNFLGIKGNPNLATTAIIQNAVFNNPKDIQLPPSQPITTTPVTTPTHTPTQTPAPVGSRFKVTVTPARK